MLIYFNLIHQAKYILRLYQRKAISNSHKNLVFGTAFGGVLIYVSLTN